HMVGTQHGRSRPAHDVGCGGAERAAGTAQRSSHRIGALVHPAGEFRADRGAAGARQSGRLPWRQWLLRGDVRGRADGGVHRLSGGSDLPGRSRASTAMARVTDAMRRLGWGAARLAPIIVLLTAWEMFARSGGVTPFMLPAPSAVAERIYDDTAGGDLFLDIRVTVYCAPAGLRTP